LVVAAHEHEHAYLCFVLEGAFCERYQREERWGTPGSLLFYAERSSHAGRFAPEPSRTFHVELPADRWRPAREEAGSPRPRCTTRGWSLACQLYLGFRSADPEEQLELEALTADLAAETLDWPVFPDSRPGWLRRVREMLQERFAEPLTLAAIADEVDLHLCHVAREFRRRYGMSIGAYLRRVRTAQAARWLAQSGDAIADIALRAGFSDQSHLGRVFQRSVGTTPARYRALMQTPAKRR
jgi:AraC family transcriptional regulator